MINLSINDPFAVIYTHEPYILIYTKKPYILDPVFSENSNKM